MPMVIPAGSYLCKLRWRLTGDPEEMISTIGITPTEFPERTVTEFAEAVYDAWIGAWPTNHLMNNYQFVGVDCIGSGAPGPHPSGSYDLITPGSNASSSCPSNCSLLVKKRTALSGHRNQGRMFLPAGHLDEAVVSSTGEIMNAQLATMQANMDQFWENLRDETAAPPANQMALMPVLFHASGEPDATEVTSFTVDKIIATQRQRMRR